MLKLTRTALIAFGLCAASALAPVLAADAPAGAASAPLPAAVVDATSRRYLDAFQRITGAPLPVDES